MIKLTTVCVCVCALLEVCNLSSGELPDYIYRMHRTGKAEMQRVFKVSQFFPSGWESMTKHGINLPEPASA